MAGGAKRKARWDYAVVLYEDRETGLFVADVPTLSVSTYGDTRAEALAKAKEAIEVTIEGLKAIQQPIPAEHPNAVEVHQIQVSM